MRQIFIYSLCLLFLYSCKEDDGLSIPCVTAIEDFSTPAINNDISIYNPYPIGSLERFPESYNYYNPVSNPNSENEIAFLKEANDGLLTLCSKELCTCNFCTGAVKVLTDIACYDLDWSIEDWLIFFGSGQQVWKEKIIPKLGTIVIWRSPEISMS